MSALANLGQPLETDHSDASGKADPTVAELKGGLQSKGAKSSYASKVELVAACKSAKIRFVLSVRGQADFAAKKSAAKEKATAAKAKEKEKAAAAKAKEKEKAAAAKAKEKEKVAKAKEKEKAAKAKEREAAAVLKEKEKVAQKATKALAAAQKAAGGPAKRPLDGAAPAAKKARAAAPKAPGDFRAMMASLPPAHGPALREVARGTAQWLHCESLAKTALHAVHEVVNPFLWRSFDAACTNLRHRNHGAANVKSLFHGTSGYDARRLCLGQVGFDPRVAGPGFYGTGAYFAEKAAYSLNYASAAPPGSPFAGRKQLIIADVAVGDYFNYGKAIDRSLSRPPQKAPSGKAAEVEFQDAPLYDSVKGGPHGGSCMFVVYLPSQAYPRYLVTL